MEDLSILPFWLKIYILSSKSSHPTHPDFSGVGPSTLLLAAHSARDDFQKKLCECIQSDSSILSRLRFLLLAIHRDSSDEWVKSNQHLFSGDSAGTDPVSAPFCLCDLKLMLTDQSVHRSICIR